MLREVDIYRAAHLMMHSHGGDAELEAARYADRMLQRGTRCSADLLTDHNSSDLDVSGFIVILIHR